jgi:glycosyltransferase involved in cell wall biosynthesis
MADAADVCLILEGTFPYVRGGVSTWVNQVIRAFPDLTFSLVFLGSQKAAAAKMAYELPANVVALEKTFLFERPPPIELRPGRLSAGQTDGLYRRLASIYGFGPASDPVEAAFEFADWLRRQPSDCIRLGNLLEDDGAWRLLKDAYARAYPDGSFIDFLWTARFMHQPTWTALRALANVPAAKMYHSVSTGYAGFMAALASRRERRPLLLSEHGIYTKERVIEITQADWIYEPSSAFFTYDSAWRALKNLWIELFKFLGRITYRQSSSIISLFGGNARLQIEFGAEEKRIEIIPNGIELERFDAALAKRRDCIRAHPHRQVIGFIGRIVPIKDIKTLLRAMAIVHQAVPQAVLLLFGPTDEDPDYFRDCEALRAALGLSECARFMGSARVEEIVPQIDLIVLTSLSEGLPLVLLEGYAAEVPVVSTDVGACREMIHGRTAADKALGRAGILTNIASPLETADALISMLRNPEVTREMGRAGRLRAEKCYRQRDIINRYRELYEGMIAAPDGDRPGDPARPREAANA